MSSLDKLVEEQRQDRGSITWCKKYPGSAAEYITTLEARVEELERELAKETFMCTHCGYHNKKGE